MSFSPRNPSRSAPPTHSCHTLMSPTAVAATSGAGLLDDQKDVRIQEHDSVFLHDERAASSSLPLIGRSNDCGSYASTCSPPLRDRTNVSTCSAPLSHSTSSDINAARSSSRLAWRWLPNAAPLFAKALCVLGFAPTTFASPTMLAKRDGGGGGIVRIIVPVIVGGLLVLIVIVVVIVRKGWHRRMLRWGETAAANFGPNPGVTELTAQQLAGPDAPIPRSRRTRRNRRTPSQISSRSLPVYMKEPGEHEVVIYRGPADMEDAPSANIVVPMPSVHEGPETPDLSIDASITVSRIYVPMPDSAHDMPLLEREDTRSTGEIDPPAGLNTPMTRDDSRSALLQGRSPDPNSLADPRGEAPSYFEVVAMDNLRLNASSTPNLEASPQLSLDEPPTPNLNANPDVNVLPEQPEPTRRSRFLGLFHHRHGSTRAPSAASPAEPSVPEAGTSSPGHRRDDSSPSVTSSVPSMYSNRHTRVRSGSNQTHRPSFSGSGSLFSAMTRSRSHLLESPTPEGRLTSPSMISINSISAPLPHTLVRTEFTYPRAGPTPEQIALISSREGLVRFGMPYGDEAIAFRNAASSSRMDLPDVPPPDFEEVVGSSRTESRAEPQPEEPTPRNDPTILPAGHDHDNDSSSSDDESVQLLPAENTCTLAADAENGTSDSAAESATSPTSAPTPSSSAETPQATPTSPPPTSSSNSTTVVDHPLAAAPSPAAAPSSQSHAQHDRTPSPTKPKAPSPLSQSAVPRAESRASSTTNVSFATAEESMPPTPGTGSPTVFATTPVFLTEEPKTLSAPAEGQSASEQPTPRVVLRDITQDDDHDDQTVNVTTPVTPTATTPTSATSDVGRAL